MKQEYFDIVDSMNQVIGQASREECHTRKDLIHRDVHILVFDERGRVFLKKRRQDRRLYGGMWESSACGHVMAGESYDSAAKRELEEELGISEVDLEMVDEFLFSTEFETQFTRLYTCVYSGDITVNSDEATEGRFFKIEDVLGDFENSVGPISPGTKEAIKRILKEVGQDEIH